MMTRLLPVLSLFFLTLLNAVSASPYVVPPTPTLQKRTPYFPAEPPSCPICEKDYWNINSCAQAAPVLSNFSLIIFNPGAFIDIIECACLDVFKAAFPQCTDCFVKTDQQWILNHPTSDLPAIVDGMRKICGIQSSLLSNVSGANNYTFATALPSPTSGALGELTYTKAMTVLFSVFIVALYGPLVV